MHIYMQQVWNTIHRRISAIYVSYTQLTRRTQLILWVCVGLFVCISIAFYVNVYRAPAAFPTYSVAVVERGSSLRAVATQFEEQQIVRSAAWLEVFVALRAGDGGLQAGQYYFKEPKSVWGVAHALATGEYGIAPVRVTIPEGSTTNDIAKIIQQRIPEFDTQTFLEKAQPYEGFLFPDTYDFLPTATPSDVIARMRETFERRLQPIAADIEALPYSEREIVTMASILGKEGITYADKQRIAGVLWTRLDIGMPLQVDAVFAYINGKTTFELTLTDLDIDSPYNTYRYRGLPPGPIANPGLESIRAALNPEETEYLYYLSDYDGNLYYSETFEEHVRKKNIYLP